MKLIAYINVAVMGNIHNVLNNILCTLYDSGLYDNLHKLYLVVNGNIEELNLDKYNKHNTTIIHANNHVNFCEFPTLDLLWEHAKIDEEYYILYLHTKGVSVNTLEVREWTDLLLYFNVLKWKDRLKELEYNDVTGVNLTGDPEINNFRPFVFNSIFTKGPPLHYSGNFWWSKSSHIKRLIKPSSWCNNTNLFENRHMCEMWLCQEKTGKYYSAHNSEVNHYTTRYPKVLYQY